MNCLCILLIKPEQVERIDFLKMKFLIYFVSLITIASYSCKKWAVFERKQENQRVDFPLKMIILNKCFANSSLQSPY